MKQCSRCKVVLPLDQFNRNKKNKDGLSTYCRDCAREKHALWRKANLEKERERDRGRTRERRGQSAYFRRWLAASEANQEKHRENWRKYSKLLREAPGRYTQHEWQELLVKYNHTCLACGKRASDTEAGYLSPDHVIPLSKGGSNDISNIQPLCPLCNRKKKSRVIDYRPNWR